MKESSNDIMIITNISFSKKKLANFQHLTKVGCCRLTDRRTVLSHLKTVSNKSDDLADLAEMAMS